tara:strand:+ start:18436 stop:18888 length:453 start_codon:yes stop_codon:yes gene_type:complete
MQVILTSNIKKLGKIGDVVKVKDGYARNFLLPNNKAIRKTEENMKKLEEKRREIEERENLIRENAKSIIEKLKNIKIEFSKESDENDQLYGSIQAKEILFALKEKSIDIDSDSLIIRKQIKTTGEHEVEISPYRDLSTKVRIIVNSIKKT